jgi:hypothetical protein
MGMERKDGQRRKIQTRAIRQSQDEVQPWQSLSLAARTIWDPSGIARSRLRFEEAFYTALIEQGAPLEAASLLWECARAHEPWAVQALLQRLAPEAQRITLTQEEQNETQVDYTRLSDAEIAQLEDLLGRAAYPVTQIAGGEGPTQP